MEQRFTYEELAELVSTLREENERLRRRLSDSEARDLEEAGRGESGGYLISILNRIPDPICIKDAEHRWVLANNKLCEIVGAPRTEVLGKSDYDLFPEPEAEIFWEKDDEVLRYGKEAVSDVTLSNATTGDTILLNTRKTLYVDANGNRYIIAIGRDVTEIKRMHRQIERSQKMESLGNLAGGIAHDFNNILYPIVGMAELLLDDLPKDSPHHDHVREILKAGRRGSDLVKQILAFSRQSEHAIIPIKPQQTLRETVKFSRATIPSTINIIEDIQDDCGLILADPTQFHQVALNIITNAYQAMEETGGTISVGLQEREIDTVVSADIALEPGKYAVLTVTDTGPGIEPRVLERIFEPYFTTKKPGKGNGIGLAVVYRIIKNHKGDIHVATEPGKGATFEMFFPLLEEAPANERLEVSEVGTAGAERILLVDDEEPIVKLEKDLLERFGYSVTDSTDSGAALALFKEDPDKFDLVITDMTMPGMTGDELAIRMISIRPDIPIILCTGYSERISKERAYGLGIKGFLAKPFLKSELGEMVREVLDRDRGGFGGERI